MPSGFIARIRFFSLNSSQNDCQTFLHINSTQGTCYKVDFQTLFRFRRFGMVPGICIVTTAGLGPDYFLADKYLSVQHTRKC